jgi:beta-carotene/zeaxanthin 4-ketolase
MKKSIDPYGIFSALIIIFLWLIGLFVFLKIEIDYFSPWTYFAILLQMHLYTGLFITAHDAMHGVVSTNKKWNHVLGWIAAMLFSYNFYWKLFGKHHEHHQYVATSQDPDYHPSHQFLKWYFSFLKQYLNIWQFLLMAITFNILKIWIPTENLVLFWMLPAGLSTLQLFYFGTYLPHKGKPDNQHHSNSQSQNHFFAFITCYFFGYHWEHHSSPGTPWWRLWIIKEQNNN